MIVNAPKQQILDGLAIGASTLCLIHCLALPALLVLLPTLTAFLSGSESFHIAALVFVIPTSAVALALGYRLHRQAFPACLVLPGIILLALGAFAGSEEWIEALLTTTGAILLAVGHALNWRAQRHAVSAARRSRVATFANDARTS